MKKSPQPFSISLTFLFLFFLNLLNLSQANETSELTQLGNNALETGKYEIAEKFLIKALKEKK